MGGRTRAEFISTRQKKSARRCHLNLLPGPPKRFSTGRLVISRGERRDAHDLYVAVRESITQVDPYLTWCHPDYSIGESKAWLTLVTREWRADTAYSFLILDHHGRLIGGCGINRVGDGHVGNLGYWIRSSETARGYATEAAIGLGRYGFKALKLGRIEIVMAVHNSASRKVAQRCGASYEGEMRNALLLRGKYHNAYLYGLIPDDVS